MRARPKPAGSGRTACAETPIGARSPGRTPRLAAHALTVIKNVFGCLVDQRYLMVNPFSGLKVRGAEKTRVLEISYAFSDAEWTLVRTIANDLERKFGWQEEAAHQARFILDFSYATGLRAGELVSLRLRQIRAEADGVWWIDVVGKGSKEGTVALPPLGISALHRYLDRRGLSREPGRWPAGASVIATLQGEQEISGTRLWAIMHRAFETLATACERLAVPQEALATKLRQASPHWMRHTHASHALSKGADLMSVRDNLRHASIATTSIYLRAEEVKRARQMSEVFS